MSLHLKYILLFCLHLFSLQAVAQIPINCLDKIQITDSRNIDITSKIYISSFANELDCEDISKNTSSILSISKAFRHTIWGHLENVSNDVYRGYLFFGNSGIEELSVKFIQSNNEINYVYTESIQAVNRTFNHQNCIFPLELEKSESILFKVDLIDPDSKMVTDVRIMNQKGIDIYNRSMYLFLGIYFGIELLIILLVPFMFLFIDQKKILFIYGCLHFTIAIHLLDRNNHLYLFLAQLIPYETEISLLFFFLIPFLLISLAKALFQLDHIKWYDWVRYIAFGFWMIIILFYNFIHNELTWFVELYYSLFFLFVCLIIAKLTIEYRKAFPLKSLIFSISIVLIVTVSISRHYLSYWGIISYSTSRDLIFIGAIIESLIFLILIAYIGIKKNRELQVSQLREKELTIENQIQLQKERNRIAAEMHDDLGGGLTSIRSIAHRLKGDIEHDKVNDNIVRVSQISEDLINNMRSIIWAMNAQNDTLKSTISYLKTFANTFLEDNGLEINFSTVTPSDDFVITGLARRNLYLCVKETLHNIVKHSKATKACMTMSATDTLMSIRICDNGIGFDPNTILDCNSNGLRNINERMKKIGGAYKLKNNELGTCVIFNYPIVKSK